MSAISFTQVEAMVLLKVISRLNFGPDSEWTQDEQRLIAADGTKLVKKYCQHLFTHPAPFATGTRVTHPGFGAGLVKQVDPDGTTHVRFDADGHTVGFLPAHG